jgi:hypothetical protein
MRFPGCAAVLPPLCDDASLLSAALLTAPAFHRLNPEAPGLI